MKYWYKTEHDWDVERADILEFTNVLQAINVAIRVLSEPEDSVIIQEPVYEPFRGLIQKTGRKTVSNQLINNIHKIAQSLGISETAITAVDSVKKTGIDDVWHRIDAMIAK